MAVIIETIWKEIILQLEEINILSISLESVRNNSSRKVIEVYDF